jgi:hypothetical protein
MEILAIQQGKGGQFRVMLVIRQQRIRRSSQIRSSHLLVILELAVFIQVDQGRLRAIEGFYDVRGALFVYRLKRCSRRRKGPRPPLGRRFP